MKTNHNIKKVVVLGPECTGKSDLSQFLASYYKTQWVPEFARQYIDELDRPYHQNDLLTIAQGQLALEDDAEKLANNILVCDTNLYVIKVWSEFKYKNTHEDILTSLSTREYDLYLLTYVDIPWEHDPQREHPTQREALYNIYLNEMKNQQVPFVEIIGEKETRRRTAIEAIEKYCLI